MDFPATLGRSVSFIISVTQKFTISTPDVLLRGVGVLKINRLLPHPTTVDTENLIEIRQPLFELCWTHANKQTNASENRTFSVVECVEFFLGPLGNWPRNFIHSLYTDVWLIMLAHERTNFRGRGTKNSVGFRRFCPANTRLHYAFVY